MCYKSQSARSCAEPPPSRFLLEPLPRKPQRSTIYRPVSRYRLQTTPRRSNSRACVHTKNRAWGPWEARTCVSFRIGLTRAPDGQRRRESPCAGSGPDARAIRNRCRPRRHRPRWANRGLAPTALWHAPGEDPRLLWVGTAIAFWFRAASYILVSASADRRRK